MLIINNAILSGYKTLSNSTVIRRKDRYSLLFLLKLSFPRWSIALVSCYFGKRTEFNT